MVLLKRKHFIYMKPPKGLGPETHVWEIPETREIFDSYEGFLERRDFYDKKMFTNEISGATNLTFWEALRAENQGSRDVENTFPEPLREPILRKAQFSTVSRINDLVSMLYKTFEHDLFAGERILIFPDKPKQKQEGIVRDKAIFSATQDRPKMVRVFVRLPNDGQNETVVDEKHVARPPRTFTKITLRSFLKHCIQKDSHNGAPWVVKEEIARQYNIPTQLPIHLRPETIRAEKKARDTAQKGKGRTRELPIIMNGNTNNKSAASLSAKASAKPHAQGGQFSELQFTQPPPPPIKYPIEDLELPLKKDLVPRPALKGFRQSDLFPTDDASNDDMEFEPFSVGPLLETWNTLNVFAQYFAIENFTFDDFAGAMFLASEKVPCELFTEVHCAVLKKLVSVEKEVWAQSLTVVDDDESGDEVVSVSDGPEESEPQITLRSSQRTQAKSAANEQVNGTSKDVKLHRAEDMLEDDEWVERLAMRDFTNGGWQLIMVGVLDQLSHKVAFKTECERILKHLAPVDKEASRATARNEYMKLDVNLRIAALQIIVMLAVETRPFKDHMEECLQEATSIRKERTSFQQQKKQLVKELMELETERKLLRPEEPTEASETQANGVPASESINDQDGEQDDKRNQISDSEAGSDDEDQPPRVVNRRISDRATTLKRKREESERKVEQQKKVKAETKEAKQYLKVLDDIQNRKDEIRAVEEEVEALDDDLRQNSCYRTKVIGRDRYYNRYYWFERNAMAFEGDAESAVAAERYANGRFWIQGPDKLDRQGIIDMNPEDEKKYRQQAGMTVQERKNLEEGSTKLESANDWGFYDTPEELDNLIAWLEKKGEREKSLRRDLEQCRSQIVDCMERRKKHLDEVKDKHDAMENKVVGIATRKKTNIDATNIKYPCTLWKNTTALSSIGQLHSDGPVAKKGKKQQRKPREESAVPEKRTTRQGTRNK